MTRASIACLREPRAILSRLLVLLALVLFAMPQGHTHRTLAHADPVAHSQVEQGQDIVSAPRVLLRAEIFVDHSLDSAPPSRITEARESRVSATLLLAPHPSFTPLAIRILPPVRGPPFV